MKFDILIVNIKQETKITEHELKTISKDFTKEQVMPNSHT